MSFGATILDAEGLRLTPDESAFFRDADPFGFIVFARNLQTPDQIRALCGDFRDAVGRDAPVLIDQEGGRVQRLRPPLARDWLPPLDQVARAGAQAPRAMYLRARLMAAELVALGIDVNCAPMLDLARPETHDFLTNRCYGGDPAAVAAIGRAVADGLMEGGVLPVMKHMPGHGRSRVDSHADLPLVPTDAATLEASDFAPFRALADLPMAMTAHLVFQAIDDRPATLSPVMIDLIRRQIGFDGLLMTDDIGMKALQGTQPQIAAAARAAGCDLVLCCNRPLDDRIAVADAAGALDAAGQARALAALTARRAPAPLDIAAAEAELAGLMGEAIHG